MQGQMPRSISTSPQPHKFFKRTLTNDLNLLASELQDRYAKIQNVEVPGVSPLGSNELWKESNSVSTMKWKEYNVFQFHSYGIRNLFDAVSSMVHEACEYYEIDFYAQQFMLQGWFNINHAHNGKLDWHEHGPDGAPNFHGYYAVNAQPSQTHYITNVGEKVNENENNVAILSEMGHPHAMGDWDWEGARITIAYDVIPLKDLLNNTIQEQHWIPLN